MHLQEQLEHCSSYIFEVQSAIALEMKANWGKTQRGNPLLIVNNYELTKKWKLKLPLIGNAENGGRTSVK